MTNAKEANVDDSAATQGYLQAEIEKTRRSDLKYAAFDRHKSHCERCQRTFEFWCDEGVSLLRNSR